VREPDPAFTDPRFAVLYDLLDGDRSDLDLYVDVVREVGANLVVDIGCGTGELAIRLAASACCARVSAARRLVRLRDAPPGGAGLGGLGRPREQAEIEKDLVAAGFDVADVRDAPDRPGKELVFLARRV